MDIDGGPSKPRLIENEWARVWGRLKAFNNKRHVGAHIIRPVADKMDITYHLLEATYVHLYFTRGPLDQVKPEANGADGGAAYGQDQNGGNAGHNALPSVSLNARKVYQVLKNSPQNNEGLHMQMVAQGCGLSIPECAKAGEELLSHSMIFTTVDDNTWALLTF